MRILRQQQQRIDLNALVESLNEEKIKAILKPLGIVPSFENENEIIFPTYCHNLKGGSDKLYFYKNSKLFHCYTECGTMNIFGLLKKVFALREIPNSFREVLQYILDLELDLTIEQTNTVKEWLNSFKLRPHLSIDDENFNTLDEQIFSRFLYKDEYFKLWTDEGINMAAIRRFNIGYDPIQNAFIIPNYNHEGELIGIRGRFLNEDAPAKYAPIYYGNKVLRHQTMKTLYGYNENRAAIEKYGKAILFESEKSVMKMDTIYGPEKNFSVALCGKNISTFHIELLNKLGVEEVIVAFDADYEDFNQLKVVREEYIKRCSLLKKFFQVSIILDRDFKLNYKDSPIDCGKEIFEELFKNRKFIT